MREESISFLEGVIVRPDLVFIGALAGEHAKVIEWRNWTDVTNDAAAC